MARSRRRNAISGQFASRLVEMLESPAYRVLSRSAHLVLSRLEIEHARHGGKENGALPLTYDHLVEYGLHRHAIAPAIRELVALGFIEITRKGAAQNGDLRWASTYRLTYRNAKGEPGDGTHEWRAVTTVDQAEAIAKHARESVDQRASDLGKARARKQKTSDGFRHSPVTESGTEKSIHQ